ncbi:MAG: hypothetical protein ABR936_15440 [Bacteroidota bacterium]|jgi:hypothetical protein
MGKINKFDLDKKKSSLPKQVEGYIANITISDPDKKKYPLLVQLKDNIVKTKYFDSKKKKSPRVIIEIIPTGNRGTMLGLGGSSLEDDVIALAKLMNGVIQSAAIKGKKSQMGMIIPAATKGKKPPTGNIGTELVDEDRKNESI